MGTEITAQRDASTPVAWHVSSDLRTLSRAILELRYVSGASLTAALVAEARELVLAEAAILAPAPVGIVVAWLTPIASAVKNPPREEADIISYADTLRLLCDDLPNPVFSIDTAKTWLRQPPRNGVLPSLWWPRPVEFYAHLAPEARSIRRTLSGARRIVSAADARHEPPRRRRPSDAEKQAVSKMMADLRAEMAARARASSAGRSGGFCNEA